MDKEAQEGIDRDLEILGLFGCPFYSRNCGEKGPAGRSSAISLFYQVFTPYLTPESLLLIEYLR